MISADLSAGNDRSRGSPERGSRQVAVVTLKNLPLIDAVFGHNVARTVFDVTSKRLGELLSDGTQPLEIEHYGEACWVLCKRDRDATYPNVGLLARQVVGTLSVPVQAEDHSVLPGISVAEADQVEFSAAEPGSFYSLPVLAALSSSRAYPATYAWDNPMAPSNYRLDMRTAAEFISKRDCGELAWRTRTIVPADRDYNFSYHSELLYKSARCYQIGNNGTFTSIEDKLSALERLGLDIAYDLDALNWALTRLRNDPDLRIGVRISGMSLKSGLLWRSVLDDLRSNQWIARRLYLEISPVASMTTMSEGAMLCDSLRKTGAKIVLEDFGLGTMPVSALYALRPDAVKIANAFGARSLTDKSWSPAAQALIALSSAFTPTVIIDDNENADFYRAALTALAVPHFVQLAAAGPLGSSRLKASTQPDQAHNRADWWVEELP